MSEEEIEETTVEEGEEEATVEEEIEEELKQDPISTYGFGAVALWGAVLGFLTR